MMAGRRRAVGVGLAVLWTVLLAACAASKPTIEDLAREGRCGARVYVDDRCQKLVGHSCCAEMAACEADASCNRIAHCMIGCKRNTSETCGILCIRAQPESPQLTRGLGLYHEMLKCAGHADTPECGPDS